MKKIVLLIAMALSSQSLFAQPKNWGAGLKFGDPSGLTLKHYMQGNAWDLTLGQSYVRRDFGSSRYRYADGIGVAFTYQWLKDVQSIKGLGWYYGLGAQADVRRYYSGYYNANNMFMYYGDRYEKRLAMGIIGVLGFEYFIPDFPFSIFLETTPYVEITPVPLGIGALGAIGARFLF